MIVHKTRISGTLYPESFNGRVMETYLVKPEKIKALLLESKKYIESNTPQEYQKCLADYEEYVKLKEQKAFVGGSLLARTIWEYHAINRSLEHLELIDEENSIIEAGVRGISFLLHLQKNPRAFKNVSWREI